MRSLLLLLAMLTTACRATTAPPATASSSGADPASEDPAGAAPAATPPSSGTAIEIPDWCMDDSCCETCALDAKDQADFEECMGWMCS
jgi:hypothetical protein